MVKYNINEEAGVIVASFGNREEWLDNIIDYTSTAMIRGSADLEYGELHEIVKKEIDALDSIVGIARKHPDDVWDEETGKKVAKDKLMGKYSRCVNRILDKSLAVIKKKYLKAVEAIEKAKK